MCAFKNANTYRYYDPYSTKFLSEDPIGFGGGDENLYRYVKNKPLIFNDPKGLEMDIESDGGGSEQGPAEQIIGTINDFIDMYSDMRRRGGDKYYHCLANCLGASRGPIGAEVSQIISDTREYTDALLKGNSSSDCEADQRANFRGQMAAGGGICTNVCQGAQ